jgi:hypothetical protein
LIIGQAGDRTAGKSTLLALGWTANRAFTDISRQITASECTGRRRIWHILECAAAREAAFWLRAAKGLAKKWIAEGVVI